MYTCIRMARIQPVQAPDTPNQQACPVSTSTSVSDRMRPGRWLPRGEKRKGAGKTNNVSCKKKGRLNVHSGQHSNDSSRRSERMHSGVGKRSSVD